MSVVTIALFVVFGRAIIGALLVVVWALLLL
jgi:hypothetical protein